jgi:hypothetical protein
MKVPGLPDDAAARVTAQMQHRHGPDEAVR